jgi:hypothetical protein
MTFRIDRALTTVFAGAFLCALGASAKADTSAGDAKVKPASARHGHRVHAKPQPHEYTRISRNATQTQYREFLWQEGGWGRPPLQNPQDAYQGYFANPVDNPRYYGTGRTTLIFR